MSYRTSDETGSPVEWGSAVELQGLRRLTASQGARSEAYEVRDETGKMTSRSVVRRPPSSAGAAPRPASRPKPAEREHIHRLLRQAKNIAREVWTNDDPRDVALSGGRLQATLSELWDLRRLHDEDWAAGLNLLQIGLATTEFEKLDSRKRHAIYRIFEDDLLGRPIGRSEMERLVSLLSDAGVDLWRGIGDIEVGDDR